MASRSVLVIGLTLVLVATGCRSGDDERTTASTTTTATTTSTAPYTGYRSAVYAKPGAWLCRPDIANNPCTTRLDATVIDATGTRHPDPFVPAERRPVDCFVVYGMISDDPGPNSDMTPDANEEITHIRNWQAQLSRVCDVYAPLYRQVPMSQFGKKQDYTTGPDGAIAYGDVLDAWKHYVANDNHGRGVVLLGQSEGGSHLLKLLADEVDGNRGLRDLLVAAYVIGWPVTVPPGRDVGGSFEKIPACRSSQQTGCVVSYASFLASSPPPAGSRGGQPRVGGGEALCVNPASPAGGEVPVDAWFRVTGADSTTNPLDPTTTGFADPALARTLPTVYVELPGLARAQCVRRDGRSYLEVTVPTTPGDPRIDEIPGNVPGIGLHLVDGNIILGDMLRLIGDESASFIAAH